MSSLLVGAVISASVVAGAVVIAPTIKIALDLAPYIYASTRCSARAGLLLDKKKYSELISASSFKEAMVLLESSYYSSIVEQAKDFVSFSALLSKDLYENYIWLEKALPADLVPTVKAIRQKFEIADIKSVVNALKNNESIGELPYIENDTMRASLQSVSDYQSFLAALENTKYDKVLSGTSLDNIHDINMKLDFFYYSNLMSALKKANKKSIDAFKEYFQTLIDIANVKLVMRKLSLKLESVSFIPHGSIDVKKLAGISEEAQLSSVMSETRYASVFSADSSHTFSDLELGLFKYLRQLASLVSTKNTLYAGSIVRYIIMKELEARNLNVIAKLKQENFESKDISPFVITS